MQMSNIKHPMIKIKFLILITMLTGISALYCSETEQPPSGNSSKEFPESELFNSTITLTVKGVRNTVVKADYIAKYPNTKETFARGIKSDFYDENGLHTSYLVADSGWINEESQMMKVTGNVVVVNEEGVKLETESLRWDPNIDKILTDDFVKITRDADILTGYGLETDQRMNKIKILKDIKGKIEEIPEEETEKGGF